MTGSEAIGTMYDIPRRLDGLVAELRRECVAIQTQWDRLGAIGGQRSDHAAELLGGIGTCLWAISETARTMYEQLREVQAAPFADD